MTAGPDISAGLARLRRPPYQAWVARPAESINLTKEIRHAFG
jgi:hypothetical protein